MTDLPEAYRRFMDEYPEIGDAYNKLGSAAHEGGPLDQKSRQLLKLALAIGAGREGAVHSHTRRSLEIDIASEEIKHVVLLAITTLGFPAAISAYTWVNDELDKP
ncbi:MAG: carboxymuconolactone decarboxylase family protein [Anaerolineae bacterium]|nr:MAG: carboxymuconolactone decarboxylase family protein [Anaerolineae bacterium]